MSHNINLTGALTVAALLMLAPGASHAGDAHGNVRYVGDGTVILGDGTRYRIPEGSNMRPPKEGEHITIQFKKGPDNRNEVTRMRVDDGE